MRRVCGTIRFFRADRRYGFIVYKPENHPPIDVFFHIEEFKPEVRLAENLPVQFRIVATPRGPKALDCVVLTADSDPDEEVVRHLSSRS